MMAENNIPEEKKNETAGNENSAVKKEKRKKLPPFTRSGVLLLDKPKDWTSHDAVAFSAISFIPIAKI